MPRHVFCLATAQLPNLPEAAYGCHMAQGGQATGGVYPDSRQRHGFSPPAAAEPTRGPSRHGRLTESVVRFRFAPAPPFLHLKKLRAQTPHTYWHFLCASLLRLEVYELDLPEGQFCPLGRSH